jgi:PAS domain S-box-containing protein
MSVRGKERNRTPDGHRLLASMVESANDAIVGLTPERKIITWNASAQKLFGYSREEAIGQDISLVLPTGRDQELQRLLGEVRAGRTVDQFETVRQRKDGSLVDVSISVSPIRDETGNVIGSATITRDITRRKRAEEALRASEARFERAFMANPQPMSITTLAESRFIDVNDSFVEVSGYTREDLIGRTSFDVDLWDMPAARAELVHSLESKGGVRNLEARMRTRRGDVRVLLSSAELIEIDGQQCVLFASSDITERKLAEEQVTLLQTITMEVAAASDISSALKVVLSRVCERTGWVIGQAWIPAADGSTLECSPAWFSNVSGLEEFRSLSEETRFLPGVGLPGRVWSSKQPLWIQDVTVAPNFPRAAIAEKVGLKAAVAIPILSGEDVTAVIEFFVREPRREEERLVKLISAVASGLGLVIARKEVEDTVLRERNFSNTTIDSLPGVFYHYDDQGHFLRWNKNFERVSGYSPDEIASLHPLDFFAADEREMVGERIGEVFVKGESSVEAGFLCKDGRTIPYFFTGYRVDIDGRPYLVGMGIDISERIHAEEALRKSQAELAHVSRVTTIGELAASIAHEINQPLGAIVGNADICLHWLKESNPNLDEIREALSDIVSDGHRATEVISRVRSLARKTAPQKTALDLSEVVSEVLALVGHEAQGKRVTLRAEQHEEQPVVQGDRVQLQQVLINLVMNGMDAMLAIEDRERLLEVSVSLVDGGGALVAVRDTGIGITPDKAEQLFKAFHTTKPGGMGMGLAISRSIVEAHGGKLWATANEGPGATFQFTLPPMAPTPGKAGQ